MLVLATAASSNPMGAQRYEREVVAGAAATLPDAEVRHLEFRSMRSHLPGNRRLPMGWMGKASVPTRGLAGRFTYPGGAVVHRMALELPPGPGRNVVTIHD
ncbi:MAG TPA: glycosyltransferase family 1 protein, partial [Actinomycetota bacterium]|nr:glycosyltransferase family 1 protein [Actinomycetota bacterium]